MAETLALYDSNPLIVGLPYGVVTHILNAFVSQENCKPQEGKMSCTSTGNWNVHPTEEIMLAHQPKKISLPYIGKILKLFWVDASVDMPGPCLHSSLGSAALWAGWELHT